MSDTPDLMVANGGGTTPAVSLERFTPVADASALQGFSITQTGQMWRAHATGGRAFRNGEVDDPDVRAHIVESDLRLKANGHRCLTARKVFGIPRLLDGPQTPWPVFAPKFRGLIGDTLFIVVPVLDTANLLPVACYPTDPLGEFDRPVPIPESIDLEVALGLAGTTYSSFSYHRRFSPALMLAVEKVRGIGLYRVRPLLRWIESRGIGALPPLADGR